MKALKDIKNILILGSGTLGLRIALASALNNYKVIIYDIREEAFTQAKKIQGDLIKILIKAGTITLEDSERALQNQIFTTDATEPWIIDLLKAYGESIQQTVVIMQKESPGYIFNTMLISVIGAAGALVTYDIASIEDVDRSWMGNFKMPRGPFGIIDEIGIDTAWHVVHVKKDMASKRFSKLLHLYIEQGKLGRKTGEGFYKYPNPSYKDENFIKG